jgi:hypothetical protein
MGSGGRTGRRGTGAGALLDAVSEISVMSHGPSEGDEDNTKRVYQGVGSRIRRAADLRVLGSTGGREPESHS